ncbi:eEF1-gamma domain-containing protein [Imleria badia]|jgi:elongation factor 1-gamma|nr:eEF1-gamma domain-containing protein [Imleria badia]
MAPVGKLYSVPRMRQTQVIKSVAAIGGLELEDVADYKHFEDNKKPEFLAKFPHGKIPALEGPNGFTLTEGTAIARYLASLAPNANLLGTSLEEQALVEQWRHFADSEIAFSSTITYLMLNGAFPYNKATHNTLIERQIRALNTLEAHLLTRTFVVGERITIADLEVAAAVLVAVMFTIDAEARLKLANTIRHLETIVNQPKLKDIFGEIEYVEKAVQYVPPKKEAKPAPAAPKEKKEKEKPKKEDDDEEDDGNLVPEEPKVKNPLDLLPKSSLNLEDWKRAYSNKDTRGPDGALEWFYANFDKEGFSVWRVDFKYNEELTLVFMSSNQIGGFFNRLEASRKYLFGSVGVLGEPNASIISGVLILRGQEVKAVVDCAPDWESYEYKKLDLDSEADKKFFESALAWDLEIDGKAWKDGKNFK